MQKQLKMLEDQRDKLLALQVCRRLHHQILLHLFTKHN